MIHKTITVPNIGCAGCVKAIELELSEMPGVHSVRASLPGKAVAIAFEAPATLPGIVQALRAIGYPPAEG